MVAPVNAVIEVNPLSTHRIRPELETPSRMDSIRGRSRGNGGGVRQALCEPLYDPISLQSDYPCHEPEAVRSVAKRKHARGNAGFALDKLEAPGGGDAKPARRGVAVRRIAAAVDMEEALRGVRKHRTLPPTAANGNGRVGIIVLRHLAFEGLVLGALGGSPGIGCPIGGGGRSQSS